jgi:hypothetical protein
MVLTGTEFFQLIEAREFRMSVFISFFLSSIATVSDSLVYILQLKFYMKAVVDAQTVQFEAQGIYRDEICARIHVGPNRVS